MVESTMRRVEVVIRGRVQGVGFRVWTRTEAQRLGLSGHVRNRSDGSVEAVFVGPDAAVSAMVEACRRGPPGARVEDVDIGGPDGAPMPCGFTILRG
ncbi:acylphosphatase [uncultured Methylobacterium sp.]|uniref:acylphosphatase n=1 Tax=uncultured Methylobacterium sp. TaxID=157278 RepID=UPI0035C9D95B